MSAELDQAIIDLIEGAPSASTLVPVEPAVEPAPVIAAEPLAATPESWRACTGQDISAMIKAAQAGFVRTPGFTRADVYAFIASKGL